MLNDAPFQAAEIIRARVPAKATSGALGASASSIAMILGSGLGPLAEQIDNQIVIPYSELPGFPVSTVSGHAGELVIGKLAGAQVFCMKGRGHFYEGRGLDVMTSAVRSLRLLGCTSMIATNAVGSLRADLPAGSLVAIKDHINLLPGSPVGGPNDARFGPRFFSMANAYDRDLREQIQAAARETATAIHEGVYSCVPGPQFETPAEVRMLAAFGADVVGMSVVPEVITARHCGMKVAALSVVTNLAEGLSDVALSHEQTLTYATLALKDLLRLMPAVVSRFGAH